MQAPHVGEILAALVSFGIIYSVIRWFKKAYKNREKDEKKEKPRIISDKEWIGETDDDWVKEDTDEGNQKRSVKIPTRVKKNVRRRDEGKCVDCGSQKNLEYDHIIPLSSGGSNSVGNIQLLCKECIRRK
jgi:5-methylcytosine-specific restriction endonuclease McrA